MNRTDTMTMTRCATAHAGPTEFPPMSRRARKPEHPGLLLRRMLENELGVTQQGFAAWIGVSRRSLGSFLRGRVPLSLDLALRLERALGDSAEDWVERQLAWSRAQEDRHESIRPHPRLDRQQRPAGSASSSETPASAPPAAEAADS